MLSALKTSIERRLRDLRLVRPEWLLDLLWEAGARIRPPSTFKLLPRWYMEFRIWWGPSPTTWVPSGCCYGSILQPQL